MGLSTQKEFGNKGKIRNEYTMKTPAQESFGVRFHGEGSIKAPNKKGFDAKFNASGK